MMNEQEYTQVLGELGDARRYPGLEQLMSAALADPSFAAQLIDDPAAAVEHVPAGVQLSTAERSLVMSVTSAADIHDFAARLHATVQPLRAER